MARNFDGSNDTILNSGFSWTAADNITVFFWNFVPSPDQNSVAFQLGASDTASDRILCHAPFSDGTLYWDYGNATAGDGRLTTSYVAYMDKWTAVGLGAQGGSELMKIYLDGAEVATQSSRAAPTDKTGYYLGVNGTVATLFHKARMAEFAIWNATLTAREHAALGKGVSPLLVSPSSLVLYLPLLGRTSPEIELIQGLSGTVTEATQIEHPRIFYPSTGKGRRFTTATAAAPDFFPGRRTLLGVGM